MLYTTDKRGSCYDYAYCAANSVHAPAELLPPTPLALLAGRSTQVLTEYLRLGPNGGFGAETWDRADAGPKGNRADDPFRTFKNSHFSFSDTERDWPDWNAAWVTFKRKRKLMLWTKGDHYWNNNATHLLEHPDTSFVYGDVLEDGERVMAGAYIILSQKKMASIDIATDICHAAKFEAIARPVLTNCWWRAIRIEGGWRIFGDCEKTLTYARLALS